MKTAIGVLLLALTASTTYGTNRPLLNALWQVESNQRLNPPDGDKGKAIGPYQIWYDYWVDARMAYGTYQDCRKKEYAEAVIESYWKRYAPKAYASGENKTLARIHNGGPHGDKRSSTLKYWKKVQAVLAR